MVTPRRAEVGIVYLAGLAQGLSLVTFPAVSSILTNPKLYHLTNSEYGALFVPLVVLAIGGSSLGPRVAQRAGLKAVFVAGLGLNLVSMAVLALSQRFVASHGVAYGLLFAATAALGAGFGATLMALNTYVEQFFPKRTNAAIPALHAFLGTGSASAPVLVAIFIGTAWWLLPLAVAGGFLILGLAGLSQPLRAAAGGARHAAAAPRRRSALLWLYAAAVLLYGICETVFGNWATLYLHGDEHASLVSAELALTAFWVFVTVGRVATAVLSVWIAARWIYRILPVVIFAAFLGIPVVSHDAVMGIVAFGVAGLGCSAFFPLSISMAEQQFSAQAAAVSGELVAAYMVGYGIGAFGVGPVRDLGHVPLAVIYPSAAVLAVAIAVLAWRVTPRSGCGDRGRDELARPPHERRRNWASR